MNVVYCPYCSSKLTEFSLRGLDTGDEIKFPVFQCSNAQCMHKFILARIDFVDAN